MLLAAEYTTKKNRRASARLEQTDAKINTMDSTFTLQEVFDTAVRQATEKACGLLDTPDSLEQLEELRSSILKQQSLVKSQLHTLLSQQVEEARRALQLLQKSDSTIAELQTNFQAMNSIGKQNAEIIENYGNIVEVLIMQQNVKLSKTSLQRFLDQAEEIQEIQSLLMKSDDNLLEAHDKITALEDIRDAALQEVASGAKSVDIDMKIFEEYFKRIDKISNMLEKLIWDRIENADTTAYDDPAVLVRIVQIIEREEERDTIRHMKMSSLPQEMKVPQNSKKTKEQQPPPIVLKEFKRKCFECIQLSVKQKFEFEMEDCPNMTKKLAALENFMSDELVRIEKHVEPCFPDEYQIGELYKGLYEKCLIEQISTFMETPMAFSDRLRVLKFLQEYPNMVEDVIENPEKFDKQKGQIIGDYISTKSAFMIECVGNAITRVDFDDKIRYPSTEKKCPFTPSCLEIFTMINSQIEEIYEAKMPDLMLMIVEACRATMKLYQAQTVHLIEFKYSTLDLVYICAYINNATQARLYTEEINDKLMDMIKHDKIENMKQINFMDIRRAYRDMAKDMVHNLCHLLMKDTEPKYMELFQSHWYVPEKKKEEDPRGIIKAISDTYQDYFTNDFEKGLLEEEWLVLLTEVLIIRACLRYLDAMLYHAHPNFKLEAIKMMSKDLQVLKPVFCDRMDKVFVDEAFAPVDQMIRLLELREVEDVVYTIGEILNKYGDFPIWIVEFIFNTRNDMEKNEKKEIIDTAKDQMTKFAAKNKPKPTIFKYYATQKKPDPKKPDSFGTHFEKQAVFLHLDQVSKIVDNKHEEEDEADEKESKKKDGGKNDLDELAGEDIDLD